MPYLTNQDLPATVKAAGYSDRCMSAFRSAFNADYAKNADDRSAMIAGHTAAKNCMSSTGGNAGAGGQMMRQNRG